LAHHLQALSISARLAGCFFAAGLEIGAQSFSHRVHLAKLTCVSCHGSATRSTKAADNNLPDPKVCQGCHTDLREVKPPRRTLVTKFNHQLHLKLGSIGPILAKAIDSGTYLSPPGGMRKYLDTKNACAACHRALETSDQTTLAVFPRMADCLVCHNQIDPPFSCVKCHEDDAQLKPVTHTADWLERHSRKGVIQDRQSCAVCHGKRFTCLGCH
jgi:hypothetical protein